MITIDLDEEFLELLYSITNTPIPSEPNLQDLKKQLVKITDTLKNATIEKNKPLKEFTSNSEEDSISDGPAILIVDDLGVITYQLKVLLSKFNLDIDCSQEIYDAVNKFKKRKYEYVIMDLCIPTEREGFILLTELKKLAASYNITTTIGVITASPRKEIEQQCRTRGVDFFLEKNNDWQTQLVNIISEYLNIGKEDEEDW